VRIFSLAIFYPLNKKSIIDKTKRHSREGGNPGFVPANAGNQRNIELGSCFHRKPWIPGQARNDKTRRVLYNYGLISKKEAICKLLSYLSLGKRLFLYN